MSEIPEDIRNAAFAVVSGIYRTAADFPENIIARALVAERERCAKIAEQTDPEKPNSYLFKRERIAAAIRAPSTGEEA